MWKLLCEWVPELRPDQSFTLHHFSALSFCCEHASLGHDLLGEVRIIVSCDIATASQRVDYDEQHETHGAIELQYRTGCREAERG